MHTITNAYMPRLGELHKTYADKGVAFVAINSNNQDTVAKIAGYAKEYKLPFPVLKDPPTWSRTSLVPRELRRRLVLDANNKIVYQGRVDDQYGIGYKLLEPDTQ